MAKARKTILLDIGLRIDREMRKNGFTAAQMAKELGISRQAFDNYRNGESEPPISKLLKMADLFKILLENLKVLELIKFIITMLYLVKQN